MTERITFESRRVGRIEVSIEDVVTFESLPGFSGRTRFVVMEHDEDTEFAWLVNLDDEDLAFVVASPWSFFPRYDPPVGKEHDQAPDTTGRSVGSGRHAAHHAQVRVPRRSATISSACR